MGATTWPQLRTSPASTWPARLRFQTLAALDPRLLQIFFLGILLGAGAWLRDFSIKPAQVVLAFAAALGTQALCGRITRQSPVSYRSAFITALSLALLLRSDSLVAHPLAAAVAIMSKFVIRLRGKHVFNPANFGLVFALLLLPRTWISPGQWGQDVAFASWLLLLGNLVVHWARRADISWSFLLFYMGALAIRIAWLGQLTAVWLHQMSNGALLLFAFFMISDPMTTPNHACARLFHAGLVALMSYVWQFGFYHNNALIWALFAAAPMVPLWDLLWIAPRFQWTSQGGTKECARTSSALHRSPYRCG